MILRIRLQRGRPIERKRGRNRRAASAMGALLAPLALMAYVLGFWRLASDIGLAGQSGISGVFSHWQIWIPLAVAMQVAASRLNRYGQGGEMHFPRVLKIFPFKLAERKIPSR
ncbi:MAG: hypothetical protein ACRD30_09970 [Bryobacteraceae bacterium]